MNIERETHVGEGQKVMQGGKGFRIVVPKRGNADVMQWIEGELPTPKANEARIRIEAVGVSGYDLMLRRYRFPGFPKTPYTPGEDVVGIVDAVGEEVADLMPGQRVAGWTFGEGGGYAEYVCRPVDTLVPVPARVLPTTAAALITNYLTAELTLTHTVKAKPGERIFVQGASGGLGSALLELGKLAGHDMYGTATGDRLEYIKSLGATPIDYRNENRVRRLKKLTGGGVDIVIDLVGGPIGLWRSYRSLRAKGRLSMLGMVSTSRWGIWIIIPSIMVLGLLSLWPSSKKTPVSPSMLSYPAKNLDWYREALTRLFALAAQGEIKPKIAAELPLRNAVEAQELLGRRGVKGKVVLVADASL